MYQSSLTRKDLEIGIEQDLRVEEENMLVRQSSKISPQRRTE